MAADISAFCQHTAPIVSSAALYAFLKARSNDAKNKGEAYTQQVAPEVSFLFTQRAGHNVATQPRLMADIRISFNAHASAAEFDGRRFSLYG